MSDPSQFYDKPPLNIDEQLEILLHRGLVVKDTDRVRHYLRFIGYYRLSGYFRSFQLPDHPDHIFQKHTAFDSILELYIFDRKLRLVVMDAVERIEVAVRATISNTMSENYGAHWYLNAELFKTGFNHDDLLKKVQRETGYTNPKKQNESCDQYFRTYKEPSLPPSWIIAEVLSIGTWSHIFRNLRSHKDCKKIGDQYGLHPSVMTSWLHSFTYLRNLCAHHSRLWNRKFTVKPKIAKTFKKHLENNTSFYA